MPRRTLVLLALLLCQPVHAADTGGMLQVNGNLVVSGYGAKLFEAAYLTGLATGTVRGVDTDRELSLIGTLSPDAIYAGLLGGTLGLRYGSVSVRMLLP